LSVTRPFNLALVTLVTSALL